MAEIKGRLFIVAFDGKDFLENGLEARSLPLRKRHILLQEVEVRVELNLDEVWRLDAFLDGSEVDAFRITFRHKLLGQSSRLLTTPRPLTGGRNDSSRFQAASKKRKNSSKTDGVKFAPPPPVLLPC